MLWSSKCFLSSCVRNRMSWNAGLNWFWKRDLTFNSAKGELRYSSNDNLILCIVSSIRSSLQNSTLLKSLFTYAPIIESITNNQRTLRCGVAADAELLRPAMLVLVQNSWRYRLGKLVHLWFDLPCDPKKAGLLVSWDHVLASVIGPDCSEFLVEFDHRRAGLIPLICERMGHPAE